MQILGKIFRATLIVLLLFSTASCSNYHLYDANKKYSWDDGNGVRLIKERQESIRKQREQYSLSNDESQKRFEESMRQQTLNAIVAR